LVGFGASIGHTRKSDRVVVGIMAATGMGSVNSPFRNKGLDGCGDRVRVINLARRRENWNSQFALLSDTPLKGFARGYI